jgi:hypothetical protein
MSSCKFPVRPLQNQEVHHERQYEPQTVMHLLEGSPQVKNVSKDYNITEIPTKNLV